jgi:hypothetical protein
LFAEKSKKIEEHERWLLKIDQKRSEPIKALSKATHLQNHQLYGRSMRIYTCEEEM